jgi:TonB dependent receptor-like, beta-barrel/CarboxypepD_reg-like domain/TonB-dependent Receptor Plug Domain
MTNRLIRSNALVLVSLAVLALPARAQTSAGYAKLRADGNDVPAMRARIELDARDAPLADVLRSIQRQAGFGLVFGSDLPGLDRRITVRDSATAAEALIRVLADTPLEVLVSHAGQAVIVRADRRVVRDTIRGVIREAGSRAPIAEADIVVEGTRIRGASDRSGRFVLLHVPPGAQTLRITRIGYAEVSVRVDAEPAEDIEIELTPVPTPLSAVVVTPGTFGVLEETTAARRTLTRAEIEAAPQIGEDPFRAISRLPGVVGHDLTASFGVRGSEGRDVLLRLDGVELIEPFHLKDVDAALSIVDIDMIGGVELMTGGFGAQYGDHTAGVFDMRTLSVRPGPPRTTLGLSLTNLRAASTGTFADERGDWLVSARRGYIDLALKLGGADANNISPTYYDILGKVEYRFTPRSSLSAHVLWAGDKLTWHDPESDDPDIDSEYGSGYAWLRFDTRPAAGLSLGTIASVGRVTWDRLGFRTRNESYGALDVSEDRDYEYAGIRQQAQFDASDRLLFTAGIEMQSRRADYDYASRVEELSIIADVALYDERTTRVKSKPDETYTGLWLTSRFRPIDPVTLEIGVRRDRHTHTDDSDISPRFNIAWAIDRSTTLRAAWGRYTQSQGLWELQAQDGIDSFGPAEHAEHRVIGLEHVFPGNLDVRVDAYDRRLTHLRSRYVNLTDDGDFFPEASGNRVLVEPDDGYARGLEFYVRRRAMRGFDWSASYALADTKERIDGEYVARTRDQRHSFAFDVSWTPNGRWRLSTAWQYHTGWPWTPTTVRLDSAGGSYYVFREYGAYNADRLPAYHRLDIRASREVLTTRGRLLFFIDVYNVYARENARTLVPYANGIDRNGNLIVRRGVDSLLPRLPSFGIQWQF